MLNEALIILTPIGLFATVTLVCFSASLSLKLSRSWSTVTRMDLISSFMFPEVDFRTNPRTVFQIRVIPGLEGKEGVTTKFGSDLF